MMIGLLRLDRVEVRGRGLLNVRNGATAARASIVLQQMHGLIYLLHLDGIVHLLEFHGLLEVDMSNHVG